MANFEVYVDPETGDEYSAEELDAINPDLKYQSEPEDSWLWRTGMRLGGTVAETAGNMFGGGLEFAAEQVLPKSSIADYLAEKGRTARVTGQRINQIQENMGEIDRSTWGGTISDVTSKGVATALPMLPAMMTGPLASGAYFGSQTLGREYGGALDEGVDESRARNVALERAGFDFLSGMLLPKGAGAATERTAANYAMSIPRTAATLSGINAATGANQELSDQYFLQDRPLEELDVDKAAVAAADSLQGGFEDTLGIAAFLGPWGVRFGHKGAAREERPSTPFGEFVEGRTAESGAAPNFETKGEPYTPGLTPAIRPSSLADMLSADFNQRLQKEGARANFAPFKRFDAPVPSVIPDSPVSPEATVRSYAKEVGKFGEEGAANRAQAVKQAFAPNGLSLDSWLPEPYKAPVLDPKKASEAVRVSKSAPDPDSSFPLPVRSASSEKIASLSKEIPSAGRSGETNSQPPSAAMSLGEIIDPVAERTPANSPGLTRDGTSQAVSPVSELRNVPERSIDRSPDLLEGKPVDYNAEPVHPSMLVARPELMQHRQGADAESGVTAERQLTADEYNRGFAGKLYAWEPADPTAYGLDPARGERYIVADGHHRLDLAKRTDAPLVDIIPLREADGFTPEDARRIAAERNIAGDSAGFVDQVKFFRESDKKLGREGTLARAQALGAKGRNARTVAFDGSDLLIREVTREAIDEKSAAILASAAPGDEAAQGRAIEMMKKGETAETATAFARLSQNQELLKAIGDSLPKDSQPDMFGDNGEVLRLARLISGIRTSYRDSISANTAALRARKKGVDQKEGLEVEKSTEEMAARVEELKNGADIVDAMEKNTGVRNYTLKLLRSKLAESDIVKGVADYLVKMRGNESGAIANPAEAIVGAAKTIQDKIVNAYDSITRKGEKGLNEQKLDPSEVWIRGLVGGRHVPGLGFYRETMSRMQVLMKKHPVAYEIWKDNQEKVEYRNRAMADFQRELVPFYDTVNTKKVGEALAAARERAKEARKQGKQLVVTDEHLRAQGLNDNEIAAYKSARNSLDKMWSFAEDVLHQHWTERLANDPDPSKLQKKLSQVSQFFDDKRQDHYFPIHRFGEYFAYGEHPETGERYYNLFKTRREAAEAARNVKERGFKERFGEIRKIQEAAYAHMPPDLGVTLQALTNGTFSNDLPVDGFKAHLVEAKMVQGYEADLKRNISEYATSLARWAANLKYDRLQQERLAKIDNRNPIYTEVSKFLEAQKRVDTKYQAVRALMSVEALGLSPSSAALNMTQVGTVSYPELSRYTKNPAKSLAIATRKVMQLSRDPVAFEKKYPDLARDMKYAQDSGQLDAGWFGDSVARHEQNTFDRVSEVSMAMFKFADRWTRAVSFIAAHDAAPKGSDRYRFARDFTMRSNFDYSTQNKPKIARGFGSIPYLFRQYGQNYYGNIKEAIEEFGRQTAKGMGAKAQGDYEAAKVAFDKARTEGGVLLRYGAPIWILGGYKAIPFVRETISILAALGLNLDELIREYFGENQELASIAMYGPTIMGGAQLTGALAPDLVPIEKGVEGAALQMAVGYPLSYAKRAERAMQAYETYGDAGRALTELAPRGIRNPITALRWQSDGAALDTKGRTVMDNPTVSESVLKGLGLNPSRYALAQEQSRRVQMLDEKTTAESAGLRNKIAVALEEGDRARALELLRKAQDLGVNITPKQVQEQMRQNKSPEYRQLKSIPKRRRNEVRKILGESR